jgi:hypothetical protein
MPYDYVEAERESDPHALPDVEIYEITHPERVETEEFDKPVWLEPGWYYRYGMPGYMPESDPFGPFGSYDEALADAREYGGVEDA